MDYDKLDLCEGRGRLAPRPWSIPPKGWIDIGLRFWRGFLQDNFTLIAAGVAYFTLLAIFPGIVLFVSIYGLVNDPGEAASDAQALGSVLPPLAAEFVFNEMRRVASAGTGGLSLVSVVSLLVALFGANRAIKAMFQALNVAYGERETRNLLTINLVGFVFTLGAIFAGIFLLALLIGIPALIRASALPLKAETALSIVRWPILLAAMVGMISILYRYGPAREPPRFSWLSIGAVSAALLWALASWVISFYATRIFDFSSTYGSFGAIILLQMWLWASALMILIGAKINAESEHQTARDSTTGSPLPIGRRGARVADEVGRARGQGAKPVETDLSDA